MKRFLGLYLGMMIAEREHVCALSVTNIVLGAKRIQEDTRQGGSNISCSL